MNKKTYVFSINDVLAKKPVSELVSIAKKLQIKGYSGKKKDVLIGMIVPKITNKVFLENLLLVIDRRAWSVLLSIRSSPALIPNSISNPCKTLADLGILLWSEDDGGIWLGIPEEIKEVFNSFETDGFLEQKYKADLLDSYALATTHLYGIIKQEDFVSLFNSQNEISTDIDETFSILIQHVSAGAPYGFWGEYLTHFLFEENEYKDAIDLLQSIEGKRQFSPKKEILLQYEDPNFFEKSLFSERIELFLRKRLRCPEEVISEIMSDFALSCMIDSPLSNVIGLLEPYNLSITKNLIQELIPLIVNFSNNSRKWANRGFTPEDVRRQENLLSSVRKGKKVGRNEPCPCGSGKKYKKCCGR